MTTNVARAALLEQWDALEGRRALRIQESGGPVLVYRTVQVLFGTGQRWWRADHLGCDERPAQEAGWRNCARFSRRLTQVQSLLRTLKRLGKGASGRTAKGRTLVSGAVSHRRDRGGKWRITAQK